jgi:hypothetical protein
MYMPQQQQHVRSFDTLRYVKKLVAVGFTQPQAEVQAETMAEIIDDNLATKKDLEEIETSLKRDIKELDLKIENVRSDLKRDIKELDLKIETKTKELDLKIENIRKELVLTIEKTKNELVAAMAKSSYTTLISLGTMIAVGVTILGFLIKAH